MTQPHHYPPGVPCWVDTWQPDPQIAARFYGALLGWEFDEPRPMPGGLEGQYLVARLGGLAVAGIGQAPGNLTAAVWSTHICVERPLLAPGAPKAPSSSGRWRLVPTDVRRCWPTQMGSRSASGNPASGWGHRSSTSQAPGR